MDGVTILNSYECLTNFPAAFAMTMFCIAFAISSAFVLFTLLKYGCDTWKDPVFLIACIASAIIAGCLIPAKKYETYYQVTIDDSVSMNEFQSKYDIIKVEGKIYTVKEVDKTMED